MRAVSATQNGVELNYMFLPTFIGFNASVKSEVESKLLNEFAGSTITEDKLDQMHEFVVDYLCNRFPLVGLRQYLNGMSHLRSG